MKSARFTAIASLFAAIGMFGSSAFATDDTTTAPVASSPAPSAGASGNGTDASPSSAASTAPVAGDSSNAAQPAPAVQIRPVMRRWFVHLNVGMPVFTYIGSWTPPGATNPQNPLTITPDQRFTLVQLVGFGYWIHPNVRLTLSLQFAETLTSEPWPRGSATPTTTSLTGLSFMSAIAWAAFTFGPVFFGIGPMAGPRWMGTAARNWVFGDVGIFTCVGASIRLPQGFLMGLAVQAPITFNPALNFAIVPAIFAARRF